MIRKINAPSYSIGQAPKLLLNNLDTPGPGSYYSSRNDLNKGIIFNRSPRTINKSPSGPGPGNYEIQDRIGSGPRPLILSRRSDNSSENSPGPADYSPKSLNSSAQYSFPKQKGKNNTQKSPGPGSYYPLLPVRSPSAIIGKSPKFCNNFIIAPGPGSYNLLKSPKSKNIVLFGRAKRMMDKIEDSPGPADYSPQVNYQSPKSFISTNFRKAKKREMSFSLKSKLKKTESYIRKFSSKFREFKIS